MIWIASVVALVLIYVLAMVGLAYIYVHPRVPAPQTPPGFHCTELDLPCGSTPVWLTEGLASGEPKSQVVLVMVHGYRGDRSSWKEAATDLRQQGVEIVIPAMPGHGAHPDPKCGFTFKERLLVVEVVDWARSRYETPPKIVLMGISMGGAACWLASEADPTVDAVITEGSLLHIDATTDRWLDKTMPLGRHILKPIKTIAERIAKVKPREIDVLGAARQWSGKPALVIQGDRDRLIPMHDAEQLAEAVGCELWIVPEARHAHCYRQARRTYMSKVLSVIQRLQQ